MLDKLYKYLPLSDLVCVLGIFELNNRKVYRSLLASKTSKEIHVTHCQEFESLSDLIENGVPKGYSVLIHLEGDVVINREIEKTDQYRNSVIYEGKEEDFFFSEYHSESKVFLSLTRKSEIEPIVKKLRERDKIISGVSVGPFVITNLFKLTQDQKFYVTPSGKIILHNNSFTFEPEILDENFSLEFDSRKYGIFDLVLIGAFIDYAYPGTLTHSTLNDVDSSGQEIKYKRKSKLLLSFILPLVLILIIFGHFYLNSLTRQLAENEAGQMSMQQTLDELIRLKEEREVKRRIFQTSGVFISDYLTGYILEICNSLPEETELTGLGVFPGPDKLKPDSKVEFDFKTIDIKGLTSSQKNINNWIQDLQSYSWVSKVEILSFHRESLDKFEFHFKILM